MTTRITIESKARRPSALARSVVTAFLGTLLAVPTAWADKAKTDTLEAPTELVALAGQVTNRQRPLDEAQVYAYEVGDRTFQKVLTDDTGHFLFEKLPAGLFKIIAIKRGFVPVIALLERWRPDDRQVIDLAMHEEDADNRSAEGYWAVRQRIPPDVLRDIASPIGDTLIAGDPGPGVDLLLGDGSSFTTQMAARSGVASGVDAQLTGADIGVRGSVGDTSVGIEGRFEHIARDGGTHAELGTGKARALAVRVDTPGDSTLSVSTASGSVQGARAGQAAAIDVETHRVGWQGAVGEKGRTGVSARYEEEENYYQPTWTATGDVPAGSRTVDVTGFYNHTLSERTSLEAGIHYQERRGVLDSGTAATDPFEEERLGLYGLAGTQIRPRVLVEIGLYSSVRDGSLSLTPHGTFVVDLGGDWTAQTSVAHRIDQEGDELPRFGGFTSAFYRDGSSCQKAGEACYEVRFSHGNEDNGQITLGALHRTYAETLRVYFSDDFFDRLESLFLVRGDTLPELQLSLVRRITPRILARLESSFARGGGGIFYATENRSYENDVRYLVTSIDTRFQGTATGIFVAFHHLQQSLSPLTAQATDKTTEVELERLQLMLTQDLDALANISSNWAVRLNLELSRGSTPYTLTPDDELIKTLTGGFSVSF